MGYSTLGPTGDKMFTFNFSRIIISCFFCPIALYVSIGLYVFLTWYAV